MLPSVIEPKLDFHKVLFPKTEVADKLLELIFLFLVSYILIAIILVR